MAVDFHMHEGLDGAVVGVDHPALEPHQVADVHWLAEHDLVHLQRVKKEKWKQMLSGLL